MKVFNTEMLLITFIFVILETLMFFYQFIYYLSRPQEKQRLYYLILLFLLLLYNITGGLFPDVHIKVPIVVQNALAYGSGFLMASYFPYYFYKTFDLYKLRFHAIYGVFLFFILPYLVFFVIAYSLNHNLDFAIKKGIVIPFFYSIVILWAILRSIKIKYNHPQNRTKLSEIMAVYIALIPWAMISVITYFNLGQRIEAIFTNVGFVVITIMFISKSVKNARIEYQKLKALAVDGGEALVYEKNADKYNLTNRELEIVKLLKQGIKYQIIANKLFISEYTVKTHLRNIFEKTGASNRLEVIHILEKHD